MILCTCDLEGIEDCGPGIPPNAYSALRAQCRRHGALAYERDGVRLFTGHVLDVLAALPADSVDCCVTSPPYWSLRKYEGPTDTIWGGDPECPHSLAAQEIEGDHYVGRARWQHEGVSRQETPEAWVSEPVRTQTTPSAYGGRFGDGNGEGRIEKPSDRITVMGESSSCALCGAWRGQLGLEPTVELFIAHLMEVMAAIWRVLKPTGVCWVNLGDGYASQPAGN